MTDGVKLTPHSDDCSVARKPRAYIVHGHDFNRDNAGRRSSASGTLWHIFACNDTLCPGTVMVRWDVLGDWLDELVKNHSDAAAPLAASHDLIVERWREGATMKRIAAEIGTTVNALGVEMNRMRRQGYDLPKRAPGGAKLTPTSEAA